MYHLNQFCNIITALWKERGRSQNAPTEKQDDTEIPLGLWWSGGIKFLCKSIDKLRNIGYNIVDGEATMTVASSVANLKR